MKTDHKEYTITAYTEDYLGLISRINAIFSRRRISMVTFNVGPSEIEKVKKVCHRNQRNRRFCSEDQQTNGKTGRRSGSTLPQKSIPDGSRICQLSIKIKHHNQ